MEVAVLRGLLERSDDSARQQIWDDLVTSLGAAMASQLWLAAFAATDAPVTG